MWTQMHISMDRLCSGSATYRHMYYDVVACGPCPPDELVKNTKARRDAADSGPKRSVIFLAVRGKAIKSRSLAGGRRNVLKNPTDIPSPRRYPWRYAGDTAIPLAIPLIQPDSASPLTHSLRSQTARLRNQENTTRASTYWTLRRRRRLKALMALTVKAYPKRSHLSVAQVSSSLRPRTSPA
jgi:hypothetical protein